MGKLVSLKCKKRTSKIIVLLLEKGFIRFFRVKMLCISIIRVHIDKDKNVIVKNNELISIVRVLKLEI